MSARRGAKGGPGRARDDRASARPMSSRAGAGVLVAALWSAAATAAVAPPSSADPALEARMMAIAEELRCLVCQNETLAASQAELAKDLRQQIRIQLGQGRTQTQILAYMTERYGDFVLYRPPWKASTVALWLGPFALLVAGAVALWRQAGRHGTLPPATLDADASRRARRLLIDESDPA